MTFEVRNKITGVNAKLFIVDKLYCMFTGTEEDSHFYARWYDMLEIPFRFLSRELEANGPIAAELGVKVAYVFSAKAVAQALLIQAGRFARETNSSDLWTAFQNRIDFYKPVIDFLLAYNDIYEFRVHH